jgi:hypothetical protein
MGELSQDIDTTRERDEQGRLLPTTGKQAKRDVLEEAGLSTSTAQRYESLAGDPDGKQRRWVSQPRARSPAPREALWGR